MTGKPLVERRESNNNGIPTQSPFLSPQTAANTTSSSSGSRLLPSPIPPPTSSSIGSQRPTSGLSAASGYSAGDRFRDDLSDSAAVRKSHSHSISSNPHTLSSSKGSASGDGKERQRSVRTLPPWVQSADEEEQADATSLLLPRTPTSARPASHNYMPTPKSNVPGRKFDHIREGAPVTLSTPVSETASKWQQFAKASDHDQNKRPVSSRGQVMTDEWMKENMPDLEEPWQPMDQEEEKEREPGFWLFNKNKRARQLDHFRKTVLNHAMVPLVVRMIVLTFSVLALSLAGAIYYKSDSAGCENNSSTWMAIIVDIIAILYTIYITLDEYTSKPLGLRSHNAKLRLIFLDLAFIVFDSANLSLAFQALTDDRWACRTGPDTDQCPYTQAICVRQKALTATLLIVLVAWLSTFAISTLRLVHRVAR